VAGVELIERICAGAAAKRVPVYFLGGAEGAAADAATTLKSRFPALLVAGTRNGYFSDDETPSVVQTIAQSGARLLLAGLGSPRQEYWLAEHLRETECGVGIGVGGSFDVISGRIERAPQVVRQLGLEWLYRLVKEPWRWRRQLALPRFVWLVALDELGFPSTRKGMVGP
jgi:N-acetylglucosaminyldiphosphoundecaprenol N-acetyl-beta-D-mannosaminyltransferase